MTTGQEMEHCLKDMVHSKQRYGPFSNNDVTTTNTNTTITKGRGLVQGCRDSTSWN